MKKKSIVVMTIILSILLAVGCAVRYYYPPEVPSTESPKTKPINNLPANNTKVPSSVEEPNTNPYPKKPIIENKSVDKKSFTIDKSVTIDDKPADLSEHTMSIKREENKGYEITPGVNVKSGGVHVQLDKENNRTIELERKPANSNNEYQVMIKKKF